LISVARSNTAIAAAVLSRRQDAVKRSRNGGEARPDSPLPGRRGGAQPLRARRLPLTLPSGVVERLAVKEPLRTKAEGVRAVLLYHLAHADRCQRLGHLLVPIQSMPLYSQVRTKDPCR
jgi:hypothetical protein